MASVTPDNADVAGRRPLLLERFSDFVETRMGLYFPAARLNDLERGVHAAIGEFGFNDIDSCLDWLLSTPLSHSQIETLASHLTVGETYFFRDKNLFEILETRILPEIVGPRRGREQCLRFWSAGCATGEEPYSLAILLTRILPDFKDWNITILATDIAPLSLQKASEGIYSDWSFRDTPRWVKEEWFTERKGKFAIAPRIKQMVTLTHLNLAADPFPAIINNTNAMDFILCRNVLMYFSRDRANAVIVDLARCLVEGGWLATSPIESPGSSLPPILQPVHFPGTILFRKVPKPVIEAIRPIAPAEAVKAKPKPAPPVSTRPLRRAIRPDRPPLPPAPEPIEGDTEEVSIRARLLADQGRLAEALTVSAEAIQADKLNPAAHYLQATILQELGKTDEATAALQRVIYIDQDFALAHFSLGHLLLRQGKIKEAGKHLLKARLLLQSYAGEEVLPEAEGMSAGRLIELIDTMQGIGERR